MKKIILMLTVLATFAVAEANKDFYVGAGFGSGSGEYTYSDSAGGSNIYATDYTLTDLKVGIIYKNNNRLEIGYNKIDVAVDGLKDKTLSGLDVDWILTTDLNNKDGMFLPFLTIGFGSYTWNDTSSFIVSGEDIKGFALNYGIGAYISVTSDVEVEVAYKAKTITWQDLLSSGKTLSLEDTMSLFYVGAKFKF